MTKMLETVDTAYIYIYIYINNLIKEKSQAFLCSICDIYER